VKKFVRFLTPVVKQRLQLLEDGVKRPDDMLQWFTDSKRYKGAVDVDKIARRQLATSFAAIQPTTSASTNALYTLATIPEFVAELRDEIREVLAAHNGCCSSKALYSMKKLDSFLKESLRFHPENIGLCRFWLRQLH
jgi:cytochrome P450